MPRFCLQQMEFYYFSTEEKVMFKGSYTVEAVFLFPVLIILMAFLFRISIGQYEAVEDASQEAAAVMELDSHSLFLRTEVLEQAVGKEK